MNCWRTLGINCTSDKEIIKSAYRTLVKRYHPDLAKTPEKVRSNTIKCAQINLAYQKALLEADQIKDVENSNPIVDLPNLNKRENIFIRTFRAIWIISTLVLLISFIQIGMPKIAEIVRENEIATAVFGTVIAIFGFAIISSAISLSTAFIAVVILDFLLVKVIPKRYFNKLLWAIVVVFNTAIAVKNLIPFKVFNNEIIDKNMFILIWNIWPLIFLISWLRTLIRYNSIKDTAFLEKIDQ